MPRLLSPRLQPSSDEFGPIRCCCSEFRLERCEPKRARFGFVAASDGHKAKPGIGYKQVNRHFFVDGLKFESQRALDTLLQRGGDRAAYEPVAADNFGGFGTFEIERTASFMSAGGLTAVHATGRDRRSIWDAMKRREVYGTSGTKILLWFDLVNPPQTHATTEEGTAPMGSAVAMGSEPHFKVRAAGSFVQQPGCSNHTMYALGPTRVEQLCANECDHPSNVRRRIERIEVVRIRPQRQPDEAVGPLIEDPWRVLPCGSDPAGCVVEFSDPSFTQGERDVVYYVRALEQASPVINAGGLRCTTDSSGACIEVDACHQTFETARDDDCLEPAHERAWSSPIYVDFEQFSAEPADATPPETNPPNRAHRGRVSMLASPDAKPLPNRAPC